MHTATATAATATPGPIRRWVKRLLLVVLALVLVVVLLGLHTWYLKPLKLGWLYDRHFVQQILDSPIMLSSLRIFDQFGLAWYNDDLDDMSLARSERDHQTLVKHEKLFRTYDATQLTGNDKISWLVADFQYKNDLEGHRWELHSYPINQLFGMQSQLPNFMTNSHSMESEKDAQDYITRLNAFPRVFDQILDGLKVRDSKNLLPPEIAVTKTLAQMQDFIAAPPQKHALAVAYAQKLDKLADMIPEDRRNALKAQVEKAITDSVYPSYKKLIAHFEGLKKLPLTSDGVWRMPDGDAYYQYRIRMQTTTSLDATTLHETGLREVARIGKAMDEILAAENLPGKTRADKMHALGQRADQMYSDDDAGRAAVLKDYQAIIDEIDKNIRSAFGLRPKVGVEVRRVPEFAEKTAPMAYYEFPSLDGNRPGVFYANLYKIDNTLKFGMRTLAYHEAIPGHHFQIALQMHMDDLPLFRRGSGFTAYMEGWALYAEQLAWEMGYQKNPLDNLGRLQAEMFRAVRLVVDTGLHAKKWSRQKAIDYMIAETGMTEDEVVVEIDRYLVEPGQALAYKVGMMRILELRAMAQQHLGDRFKLSDFHDTVLRNGAVPLDVLDVIVKDWVQQVQKGTVGKS